MYDGFLSFGGNEIVNNERAFMYSRTAECPMTWLKGPRCETLADALQDTPYHYDAISEAPWYDFSIPDISGRFFGVYATSVKGIYDSTRQVQVSEGLGNGGIIGRTRKAVKSLRVRALLLAQGLDALEYGNAWLSAALDPGACGQHGVECGTTDLHFLSQCPPPRRQLPIYGPWEVQETNLALNPGFEAGTSQTLIRENLGTNPNAIAATGFTTNNAAIWTATRNVPVPALHPQDITTAAKSQRTGTSDAHVLSMFNIDSLGLAGATRRHGAWFYVDADGYEARLNSAMPWQPLPANVWTWILDAFDLAGSTNAAAYIRLVGGVGTAPATDTGYITGVTALEQGMRPTEAIWGGRADSGDYEYDWAGTANASVSRQWGVIPDNVAGSGGAVVHKSTEWKLSGDYSLRIAADSSIGADYARVRTLTAADAGKTYTILATLRLDAPLNATVSAGTRRIGVNYNGGSGTTVYSTQPPNVAGEHPQSLTVTIPADVTSGEIRLYRGSSSPLVDAWWDEFFMIEVPSISEPYTGPYFDGNTDNGELDLYEWTGTPNASTSTYSIRTVTIDTELDDTYQEYIDLSRRYMHGAAAVSGPFEVQQVQSGEFWMLEVEFTISAGRPWVFSATKAVQLPTTPPTVIQDIPYNLVKYPSAELSSGSILVATNHSTNPSLEVDATGWTSAAATIAGTSPAAYFTSGRIAGDLAAVGTASFRGRILGNLSTEVASSQARVTHTHTVTHTPGSGKRLSFNIWGAAIITSGTAVSSVQTMRAEAQWYVGATPTGAVVNLGTAAAGEYGGKAFSFESSTPPAGATSVQLRVIYEVTWRSSASGPNNSDIRLFADAAAVTTP